MRIRKNSSKGVRISQTFKRITVGVPATPGIDEPLPTSLTFYIDSRFTTEQLKRISRIISGVILQWNQYYEEREEANRRSPLKICTAKYARFNLSPVWFEGKIGNANVAFDIMMIGLTRAFIANGFGRAPRAQIRYPEPATAAPKAIRGVNASNPDTNSLTVTINPRTLSRSDLGDITLMGSMLHAWLHRIGYRHATGKYTGYLIGETAMCLMRNSTDKPPGVPDSRFIAFLD